MTPRREYALAVALGLLAGALVTAGSSRAWATATARAPGLPSSPLSVEGTDVAPVIAALGPVILAGAVAVVATRGLARRICGALVGLAGATVAVQVLTAGAALETALREELVSGTAGSIAASPWRWVCLLGAVLAAVFGALVIWRADRWPAMGSRYEAPATRAGSVDEQADLWRALDRGEDPTR